MVEINGKSPKRSPKRSLKFLREHYKAAGKDWFFGNQLAWIKTRLPHFKNKVAKPFVITSTGIEKS